VHHLLKKNQRIKRKGKKEGGVKGSITNHGSILGSAENIKWTNQMDPSMEKKYEKKKSLTNWEHTHPPPSTKLIKA